MSAHLSSKALSPSFTVKTGVLPPFISIRLGFDNGSESQTLSILLPQHQPLLSHIEISGSSDREIESIPTSLFKLTATIIPKAIPSNRLTQISNHFQMSTTPLPSLNQKWKVAIIGQS